MSTQTAWLEQFTGISLAEGAPDPSDKEAVGKAEKHKKDLAHKRKAIEAQEQGYEKKRQQQALVLAQVRAELVPVRAESKEVLSTKITAGPLKGKSFLAVEGEQIDEIDADTLRMMGGKKLSINQLLPGDIGPKIYALTVKFDRLGAKLSDATYEDGGKSEPLFTTPQVQAEYWVPLRLERIYPDGLVLDKFSETQQMLDATNQLYFDMCEQKKLAGQLTPEIDLVSELLGTGKDIAGLGGDLLGALGGVVNAEGMKLAKDILGGMSEAFGATDAIYKQVKESDYAGASAGAIDLAGKLTGALLCQIPGVSKGTVDAVTAGFGVGSAAVLMGKGLAQYRSGEGTLEDALGVVGDLIGKSLTLAADQTSGGTSDGLRIAAKAAPSALRIAGLGSGPLVKAVREGDFPGVVKTLGTITTEVLGNLPGIDIKMVEDVEQIASAGTIMIYKMAVNAKRGDLQGAFNTAIEDISENLENILSLAGVPEEISSKVVGAYRGSTSASKAVQMLMKDPGNVTAVLAELTVGLDKALSGTGDPVLKEIGGGIKTAVEKMVSAQAVAQLYKDGDFEGALTKLIEELGSGIESIVAVAVPTSGEEEDEEEDEDDADDEEGDVSGEDGEERQKRQLKKKERIPASRSLGEMIAQLKGDGPKPDAEKLEMAVRSMEADLKAEREAADTEEAQLLLAQAELDLKSLTEAEKTGAEASNIDNMIADLLRDRMILKIATQIAQGGASFLAQFVPALGAVSAGVKLAAQLVAVAQRAKQLDAWIKSQKDLAAAQSALSSSASNFVKNQGQQLAHYSAQAFFAAAQLAGEITKLADPTGVGAAISGIAAAGAKAEQMLMERKDKIDIERAWKVTQKSLRNPKNRQLGLEARKLNPSLAKFSIAWGAVVLKDPLARNAMKACGLTESSLKSDSADVNKVVQYLEIFYEDDKSLYRDSKEPVPDWVPTDVEVSLKSWSQLCLVAINKPKLKIANVGLLEGLLGQLMEVEQAFEATAEEIDAAKGRFMLLREIMENAMTTAGIDDPALEPPPIAEIEKAIDDHQGSLVTLYALLTQMAKAYTDCHVEPITPGTTPDPNVQELQAVLKQLSEEAKSRAEVAEAEAQGVETSKLDLKGTVEALRRKAAAKATSKQETEAVK